MFKTIVSSATVLATLVTYMSSSASVLSFENVSPSDKCDEQRLDQNIYFSSAGCWNDGSYFTDLLISMYTKYGYRLSDPSENNEYPVVCFEQNTGEIFVRKNSFSASSNTTKSLALKPLYTNSFCRSGTYRCVINPDNCFDRLVFEFKL